MAEPHVATSAIGHYLREKSWHENWWYNPLRYVM